MDSIALSSFTYTELQKKTDRVNQQSTVIQGHQTWYELKAVISAFPISGGQQP